MMSSFGHWFLTPLVFAILLALGLLLVVRVLLLGAQRRSTAGPICPSKHCGHHNPPQAHYCARCGQELPHD